MKMMWVRSVESIRAGDQAGTQRIKVRSVRHRILSWDEGLIEADVSNKSYTYLLEQRYSGLSKND